MRVITLRMCVSSTCWWTKGCRWPFVHRKAFLCFSPSLTPLGGSMCYTFHVHTHCVAYWMLNIWTLSACFWASKAFGFGPFLPISTMLLRGRCLAYHFFIRCSILDSDTQAEFANVRSFSQGRLMAHLGVHNMQCIRNWASPGTWCEGSHLPWIACRLWARTRDPH